MEIIRDTIEFNIPDDTVVTIGKFDGIHKGHLVILDRMREFRARGYKICVLTFDKTPSLLGFGKDKQVLMNMCEKEKAFDALGIDYLVEFPFNENTAAIEAIDFIEEFIVGRMNAKAVVVGTDCSFGKGAKGSAQMLRDYGPIFKYEVVIMEKILDGDREISSTYLRELMIEGEVKKVDYLSFRPYFVHGQLKVNPANFSFALPIYSMAAADEKVLPKSGLYYTLILYDDSPYTAITFVSEEGRLLESYLYSGNVRGITSTKVSLCFLERVRDELGDMALEDLNNKIREEIFEGQKWHMENSSKYIEEFSTVMC